MDEKIERRKYRKDGKDGDRTLNRRGQKKKDTRIVLKNANKGMTIKSGKVTGAVDEIFFFCGFKFELVLQQ